ncbi:Plant disease resistance response protein [Macleaya cordata]|uniref:Dirigent protein n=1 Tax=Macleaya cordata TaxID=56857 RepID=A0A200R6F6_MACCD|nr:Plant disease resistance response protein [Macleaya cordata]
MEDVLCNTDHDHSPKPSSTSTQVNGQLPYPANYPMGHFPPPNNGGNNPLPESNPTRHPFTSSIPGQYQTFDPSSVIGGLSFPAIATLQGLELGTVTPINEQYLIEGPLFGASFFGKAKGVYVKSSSDNDEGGHMMAMNVMVASSGYKDSLRFFGVHRTAAPDESHIAVIGGTGKFHGANGYATVKTVTVGLNDQENKVFGVKKQLLMFTVYLSH